MPRDADELVELLDLETIDDNLFRGAQMPTSRPIVFGGQAAAQAVQGVDEVTRVEVSDDEVVMAVTHGARAVSPPSCDICR